MDAIQKDLASRKDEIEKEIELLFTTNLKIVDWDVPEADDTEAAYILWNIMNDKLQDLKAKIDNGEFKNY